MAKIPTKETVPAPVLTEAEQAEAKRVAASSAHAEALWQAELARRQR